ncbi:hypothetical protein FPV67DRAFT_1452129 [Lyophyllum atratum]|nr:hypothetical protein FPV67DRAFT_1452129 [Lyophyllum atratum]
MSRRLLLGGSPLSVVNRLMPLAWLQIISEIEVGPKVELSLELRKPALAAVGPGHTVSCDDDTRPGVEVDVSSELQGATNFDVFTENQEQQRLEEIVIWLAIIAILVDFSSGKEGAPWVA